MEQQPARVPWRIIFACIGAVVVTFLALALAWQIRRVLLWTVIAAFFAAVMHPAVSWLQRRAPMRRSLAALAVVSLLALALVALAALFVPPLVSQARKLGDNYPQYVEDVAQGRGNLGELAKRLRLDTWVRDHQDELTDNIPINSDAVIDVARAVGNGLIAVLTILVLSVLMVLQAPLIVRGALSRLREPSRSRARKLLDDSVRAVNGYVIGNLFISLIAGVVAAVALVALGVPFAIPLAVWVAFADLIPLVGATLGAIPAVLVAFVHSVPAGIAVLVVFIVYQQFENHVLQVTVMSRTVALNPLLVLVSVLVGVELLGFAGALLAIPVGGVIQVIAKDLWSHSSWYESVPAAGEPPGGEG